MVGGRGKGKLRRLVVERRSDGSGPTFGSTFECEAPINMAFDVDPPNLLTGREHDTIVFTNIGTKNPQTHCILRESMTYVKF